MHYSSLWFYSKFNWGFQEIIPLIIIQAYVYVYVYPRRKRPQVHIEIIVLDYMYLIRLLYVVCVIPCVIVFHYSLLPFNSPKLCVKSQFPIFQMSKWKDSVFSYKGLDGLKVKFPVREKRLISKQRECQVGSAHVQYSLHIFNRSVQVQSSWFIDSVVDRIL